MSDDTNTNQAEGFDWGDITGTPNQTPASQGQGRAAAVRNLPPTPAQTGILAGRLPIRGDTGKAILQLPEPVKDLHCALVMVNSGVLSDCHNPAKNRCVPVALRGNPINDREIEVILDGGDHVAKGLGWTPGNYPGATPTTREIEVNTPYVEVLALVGVACGCDSQNWASDNEWGQ